MLGNRQQRKGEKNKGWEIVGVEEGLGVRMKNVAVPEILKAPFQAVDFPIEDPH